MTVSQTQISSVLEEYRARQASPLSVFHPAQVGLWQDFYTFSYAWIGGNMCLFAEDDLGMFQFLPPLAAHVNGNMIAQCFQFMEKRNGPAGVTRIENVPQELLPLFDRDVYDVYQKAYEYVYRKSDIMTLAGNAYKSKRHAVNQFVNHYTYEVLPYDRTMAEECIALYQSWMQDRLAQSPDDLYAQMIKDSFLVEKKALQQQEALGLIGRVVKVGGFIKAYTFGYALSATTFCICFETADLSLAGLPVFVFQQFCSDPVWRGYDYVNVADDGGLENLRRVKMSFHPAACLPVYVVKKSSVTGHQVTKPDG